MALPATDNFTAADGTVLTAYSANWTAIKNDLVINTNAVAPGAFFDRCAAIWNTDAFANDHYSQAVLTAIDVLGTVWTGVAARGTAGNYYGFNVTGGARELISYIAGSGTVLASDTTTCTVGDLLKIVVAGTTISTHVNGVQIFSVTDSGLASGSAGLSAVGHFTGSVASRVASWEGGDGTGGGFDPTQDVADTGTGTDADSGVLAATIAETASGADASAQQYLATVTDTGTGVDNVSGLHAGTIAESGTGVDAVAAQTQPTVTDTASGSDTTSSAIGSTGGEVGSGAEAVSGLIAATVSDSAVGVDASSATDDIDANSNDTGVGVDTASSALSGTVDDVASANDLPSGFIVINVGDVAVGVDYAFAGSEAILGACTTLTQRTSPQTSLIARTKPIVTLVRTRILTSMSQRTLPVTSFVQRAKPRVIVTQRSC